ncbi:RidA family protein [uncultured Friedmanniella sp.]|uniref:RidA family protein n=1 Tax=uncultured Friedmanniella sp. TaxID=335381 RepID=UPI0035CB4E64
MSSPSTRLEELGLRLPEVAAPLAAYVPAVQVGNLVYTSGQLPSVEGRLASTGKVGAEVTSESAAECAGLAALNALAAIAAEVGGLDGILRVVKVTVFVASDPGFTGHAQVANGASQLLGDVFGGAGKHARSAVGVAVLPLDSPVEVELIVEVAAKPTIRPL